MIVVRYTPEARDIWNEFICASKNGTFLLLRDYMDYHSDRFPDHSLLVKSKTGRVIAVMPSHRDGDNLVSHGGLTYGGFISDSTMTTPMMLDVFGALLTYASESGISKIRYKTVPSIYARGFAEEDRYALFRNNARLYRRDVLAVVDQSRRINYQERRLRKIRQAEKSRLAVTRCLDYAAFWAVMETNLAERFGVQPAHTLAEITLLAHRFPNNIHLHICHNQSGLLAGVVTYVTPQVVHAQYISSSETGRKIGALDLLFAELLDVIYKDHPYFDFGISTEQDGRHLNLGLVEQKEGFGARAVVHDHYEFSPA